MESSQLGRQYLATYYPSFFAEDSFLKALDVLDSSFSSGVSSLDIDPMIVEYRLRRESIENAAILSFLSQSSLVILESCKDVFPVILDMGGGPTLYQHIPLSLVARAIVHVEPVVENRHELELWIGRSKDAYDWLPYFHVLKNWYDNTDKYAILRRRQKDLAIGNLHEWEDYLRMLLSGHVMTGDVFRETLESVGSGILRSTLGSLGVSSGVDIITSNFLLESATDEHIQWIKGMDALAAHVKPGGFLIMMAIRHAEWYQSGSSRIPAYSVDEQFLSNEVQQRGFCLMLRWVITSAKKDQFGYDGMIFLLAQKLL